MNFFRNLFGKENNLEEPDGQIKLTPEQFFNTDHIKRLLVSMNAQQLFCNLINQKQRLSKCSGTANQ